MTHDIQDLLNLIKELEERITALERCNDKLTHIAACQHLPDNHWYWDH